MYFRYQTYWHYRINNIANTIIKTTNAINVPPTATGITLDSRSKWSAFISKKRETISVDLNDKLNVKQTDGVQIHIDCRDMYPAGLMAKIKGQPLLTTRQHFCNAGYTFLEQTS